MKSKGNQAYKEKDYRMAIQCYTDAIGNIYSLQMTPTYNYSYITLICVMCVHVHLCGVLFNFSSSLFLSEHLSLTGHNPLDASFYGNRSAAYMMLNQYQSALDDARHCITIDDTFVKGHLRAAKCYMMMGNPALSIDYYDKALLLQPRNTQAVEEVSDNV